MGKNPFAIIGYPGEKYFCDRKVESKQILSAIKNGRNLTIYSLRRLGKTGLIKHVFDQLSKLKFACFHVDIYATKNAQDFAKTLINSIVSAEEFGSKKKKFISNVIDAFKSLRPKISFDPLSGMPSVELDIQNNSEADWTLDVLFNILNEENRQVIIAIDELQQIVNYPNGNMEAILRTYVQKYANLRFIFSGSKRHIILSMFSDVGKPFYRSTELMQLNKIDSSEYAAFIKFHFKEASKEISDQVVDEILQWTERHTFFTQYFCNKLFELENQIEIADLNKVKQNIFLENETVFFNYRNLLTQKQWKLLTAIGIEEEVYQPTAISFLNKHKLGSASTVSRGLERLLETDMIYKIKSPNGNSYKVYDVFLSHWLKRTAL